MNRLTEASVLIPVRWHGRFSHVVGWVSQEQPETVVSFSTENLEGSKPPFQRLNFVVKSDTLIKVEHADYQWSLRACIDADELVLLGETLKPSRQIGPPR